MRPSAMTARYAGTHACFWAALCPLVTFSALYLQRKGFSTVQVGTVLSLATIFPAFVQTQVIITAQKMKLGEKALGIAPQPEKMICLGG